MRDRELGQTFDFYRPNRQGMPLTTSSALLHLTSKQHDVLYALAGCRDVLSTVGNVTKKVCCFGGSW